MIKNDRQYGKPFIDYQDTQAAIEALTGLTAGSFAYATDIQKVGFYNGVTWTWIDSVIGTVNVYNETLGADGVSTIYYLANVAQPGTIRVYVDGIRQPVSDDTDPTDVVTFSVAPTLGALLLFDYELSLT